jgi:hypothetical protein
VVDAHLSVSATRNVICMKWGTLYGAHHVNRLFAMVRRHLPGACRFICFTDDDRGLDPAIEALPLPQLRTPPHMQDTRWLKLACLRRPLADLQGQALFLDLDLVVVDDLTPFFELPGQLCVVRDADLFRRKWVDWFRPQRRAQYARVGNTSVFRFPVGAFDSLVQAFEADPEAVLRAYRNEQEYVTLRLHEQGAVTFWPQAWCRSFKNHCVPRGVASYLRDPTLPPGARIVLFAGNLKQDDVLAGRGGKFYRRIGPAPWLAQHWQ